MDNNISYTAQPEINPKGTTKNNGFVCGLIALILSVCCCGGGIINIVLAIISLVQANAYKNDGGVLDGQYKAGKICAIVSFVVFAIACVVGFFIGIIYGAAIFEAMNSSYYYY